jgi:hypothetical protein
LPYAGGWKEQPAGVLERMQAAKTAYEAVRSWRDARLWVEWSKEHPQYRRMINYLINLRQNDASKTPSRN